MIWRPPMPRRPDPDDPRARVVVEWTDVVYYVFWRAFCAGVLISSAVTYGSAALSAL